jgi:hypothetical protein
MSQSKNRIFIGNIPRKWEDSDLKNAVMQVGPGIVRVDLMKVQFCSSSPIGFGIITAISCTLMLLCFFPKELQTAFKFVSQTWRVKWHFKCIKGVLGYSLYVKKAFIMKRPSVIVSNFFYFFTFDRIR